MNSICLQYSIDVGCLRRITILTLPTWAAAGRQDFHYMCQLGKKADIESQHHMRKQTLPCSDLILIESFD